MESKITERLEAFACSLAESRVDIPPELKLRTAEMILRVMARKKRHFGLFVILGWQRKWNDHLDISDDQHEDGKITLPKTLTTVSYTHLTLPTICSV